MQETTLQNHGKEGTGQRCQPHISSMNQLRQASLGATGAMAQGLSRSLGVMNVGSVNFHYFFGAFVLRRHWEIGLAGSTESIGCLA